MAQQEPQAQFACAGCLHVFKEGERRDCCQNCDSSGTRLPEDEIPAAMAKCSRRKKYLHPEQGETD